MRRVLMKRARPLVPAAPKPKPKPSKPKPSSARPDALLTVPANGLAADAGELHPRRGRQPREAGGLLRVDDRAALGRRVLRVGVRDAAGAPQTAGELQRLVVLDRRAQPAAARVLAALDGGGRRHVVPRRRALDAQRRRRRRRGRGAAGVRRRLLGAAGRGRSSTRTGCGRCSRNSRSSLGAAPAATCTRRRRGCRLRCSRTTSTPSCSSSRARSTGGCTRRATRPSVCRATRRPICAGRSGRADRAGHAAARRDALHAARLHPPGGERHLRLAPRHRLDVPPALVAGPRRARSPRRTIEEAAAEQLALRRSLPRL